MNCDCSIDHGEYADVYREEFPVARKTYKCYECGEDILPREKYHKATGLWKESGWDTFHTCMPCYHIRMEHCSHGYLFGGLREAIEECLGFDYLEIPEDDDAT